MQARKRANEMALAMDRGGGDAVRAAAEPGAKETESRSPLRIDVSQPANFRYSKIKVGGNEEAYIRV